MSWEDEFDMDDGRLEPRVYVEQYSYENRARAARDAKGLWQEAQRIEGTGDLDGAVAAWEAWLTHRLSVRWGYVTRGQGGVNKGVERHIRALRARYGWWDRALGRWTHKSTMMVLRPQDWKHYQSLHPNDVTQAEAPGWWLVRAAHLMACNIDRAFEDVMAQARSELPEHVLPPAPEGGYGFVPETFRSFVVHWARFKRSKPRLLRFSQELYEKAGMPPVEERYVPGSGTPA